METLAGMVERITFANEENGFCVIKIKSRGFHDLVTVVGNLAAVNVGAVVYLKGEWRIDGKYGKQFVVQDYRETVPATVAGIEKYLGSGLIKGIGPVNAKRIVCQFRELTIQVIEEEPDRLIEVEGIGPKRVGMIKRAWEEQKEIKNVMLFLQSHGVSTSFAVKIYKAYGNKSIEVVKQNPYRLADEIWGIGFRTADKIAQKMGFDKDSYERCRAGIIYVLNELSNEGHCYATREQLVEESVKILEQSEENIQEAVEQMLAAKALILDFEDAIYLPPFYFSEVGVAKLVSRLNTVQEQKDYGKIMAKVQKDCGIVYDEIQEAAIKTALMAPFMVLTGGPGTGKTTTTLGIIQAFLSMGKKVLLAAPTGRAAKRMTEVTGLEAKTIHRLLEYSPAEGYKRNEQQPLVCDVLIIDEASMIDLILMYNLMKAVPAGASVILVGDADQLPSVGAGNVLRDIIESACVHVVSLTRIFRQAQDSMIVLNAHRINRGEFPQLRGGKNKDFFFVEEEVPEQIPEQIRKLCATRLPGYFGVSPVHDIQVLCPMQRGEAGTGYLNALLQETLNPSQVVAKYGPTTFKTNDKVMQIKNNYDKGVFNGDIGVIKQIDLEDKKIVISFDENEIEYDLSEMDEVVLAYAITVHKSQGSEYKIVVAPFTTQHFMMLQRNLLYTCVTRAKQAFVAVGSQKALAMAVKNNKTTKRNTMLARRIGEQKSPAWD
ncbi:ATP-dependent RecD-like DNA helicase [Candidatus Formimonas warabiya]|uniref:ATP-dependent RecD2 DNA helicase n=1 Tax=Formimonas warabiya TaxID=1761012 RepID=A0A3G1KMJ2_FORW1|nr:ATP-dependent RecD-like DNA helicase [Candidatus Formimonas warabiya]ATW23657.1 recombinase RecD [Candidatus Formimonas warabiya]